MTKYRDETAASQSAIHRCNPSQTYRDQQHLPLKQPLMRKKLIDHGPVKQRYGATIDMIGPCF